MERQATEGFNELSSFVMLCGKPYAEKSSVASDPSQSLLGEVPWSAAYTHHLLHLSYSASFKRRPWHPFAEKDAERDNHDNRSAATAPHSQPCDQGFSLQEGALCGLVSR